MRRLLLAPAIGLAASMAQAETITVPTWGCRDLQTVERMNEAIIADDYRTIEAILNGGGCTWWVAGTRVEVIDRHADWDLVCVARPGSDVCFWTDREATDIEEE